MAFFEKLCVGTAVISFVSLIAATLLFVVH